MAQNEEKMQADQAAFGAHYIDDTIHADKSSRTAAFIKKFLQRKTAVLGLVIILFFVVVAIVGPSIAPYDYTAYDYSNMLSGPSAAHWFGTDHYGRDIFSRMLVGTS